MTTGPRTDPDTAILHGRRRSVVSLLGAMIAVAALTAAVWSPSAASSASAMPSGEADTVLRDGYVYTVDPGHPVAQALAIDHGEIVYVGGDRGVARFVGPETQVIDLHGRMVMPGLVDAHLHEVMKPAQPSCDLEAKPLTVAEFRSKITACLANRKLHTATPGAKDDFLPVTNFYIQFLRPAGTEATKQLFAGLTDRPIIVETAITGHEILVNQAALDLAGITASTPDPEGGHIVHGADGQPNGLLTDLAMELVRKLVPPPPPITVQEESNLAAAKMKEFAREGVTTFFNAQSSPEMLKAFALLRKENRLTARAHFAPLAAYAAGELKNPPKVYAELVKLRRETEVPRQIPLQVRSWRPGKQQGRKLIAEPAVSVDAAKFYLDGVLQFPDQSAALFKPYLGTNGKPRTGPGARGDLFITDKVLDSVLLEFDRLGFQPHVHAIGDRAVHVALNAFQYAQAHDRNLAWDSRPTIAHAELVDPRDYPRFKQFDVTASMGLQWAKPAPDSTEAVKPYLGNRFNLYEPEQPITAAGGRVSMGSDCCLDPFLPWFDLEVSILREADWGPEFPEFAGKLNSLRGLSLAQAIRVVTVNGAYQLHQDQTTGSLQKGKLADLVVLNQNIAKVPRDDISKTEPLLTMVGGKRVWVDPSMRSAWGGEQSWTGS